MINKNFLRSRNNVFLSWIASYTLILILPIMLGTFTYFESVKIINEEVNQSYYNSINQLKIEFDNKIHEIRSIGAQIAVNPKIMNLIYSINSVQGEDTMNIIDVQKDLAKFTVANSFIKQIYIYIENGDYIFTSSNYYTYEEFEELSLMNFAMQSTELIEILHTKKDIDYRIINKGLDRDKTQNRIIVAIPLNLFSMGINKGTIVVQLDEVKVKQLLHNLKSSTEGSVLIVNSKNEYIGIEGIKYLSDELQYNNLGNENNIFYNKILNLDMAIVHSKSDLLDWQYVSITPSKVFLRKVQYITNTIYIYVGICLVIGCFLVYFFAKRNYSPIKKMIQLFITKLGSNGDSGQNEFSFLKNSFEKIIDQNASYEAKLKQQKEAMANNFFIRLVKGRIKNINEFRENSEYYSINFSGNEFLAMVISIEKIKDNFFDNNEHVSEEESKLVYFVIKNIFEELANQKYVGYVGEVDGVMICLVNIISHDNGMDKTELIKKEIMEIAYNSIECIKLNFGISLSVGISEIHSGMLSIGECYSEVLEIIEYKALVGEDSPIIHYSSIKPTNKNFADNYNNLEKQRQFINCVVAEDYKNAASILNEIMINGLEKDINSIQLIKCRMFGLISSMLNVMGVIKAEIGINFYDELDTASRLLNAKSIAEFKQQVNYIFGKIIDYYDSRNAEQEPIWIAEVIEFVEKHYSEPDLSIGNITQKLNMSNSYLSRAFKKHTGTGLLNYIHKVRLEKSKELIKTDISIKAIAEKVGYIDSKAMISAFKKYEGTTPGKFRDRE